MINLSGRKNILQTEEFYFSFKISMRNINMRNIGISLFVTNVNNILKMILSSDILR